jgi:hypothetical protein
MKLLSLIPEQFRILLYFLAIAVPQVGSAQFAERQSMILKNVMAVGGTITKKDHEQFWSPVKGEKLDAKTIAFMLECVDLGQEYQLEIFRAALASYRNRKVTVTKELSDAENKMLNKGFSGTPWPKGSPEYNSFFVQFYAGFKEGKPKVQAILEAAATRGSIKSHQGITVMVDEPYLTAIISGLDDSFRRIKRLASPTWKESED